MRLVGTVTGFGLTFLTVACTGLREPETRTIPPSPCEGIAARLLPPLSPLRLSGCEPAERRRLERTEITQPTSCDMGTGVVRAEWTAESPFEPRVTFAPADPTRPPRELHLLPDTGIKDAGASSDGELACDPIAGRFYVANSMLGYVAAFDSAANEIWRVELPGFKSIVARLREAPKRSAEVIMGLLDSDGSAVAKLVVSGPYLAVEYRTGDLYWQSIYHRTGVIVTTIGPWNGVLTAATDGGWRVVWAQSNEPGAYFFPDHVGILTVQDDSAELLGRHLIAAITPKLSAGKRVWSLCPGGAADLEEFLGTSWNPGMAKLAIRTRTRLGASWLEKLPARIGTEDGGDFAARILRAGVDVELMGVAQSLKEPPGP